MSNQQQFSCYIIGEEALAISCAELIIAHGHYLKGIISSAASIKEWASNNHITYIEADSDLENILANATYDYLFSIANQKILTSKIINSANCFSINYHNSLLPRYAGVYATSWCILNGEKHHGITWHVMTDEIDKGDILKQEIITIEPTDTALSLNVKCQKAAIHALHELIKEISYRTYKRITQDIRLRQYYSFRQKPFGNGWINWKSAAEDIEKNWRAFYLGNSTNQLSLIKFTLGNHAFVVNKLQLLPNSSTKPPGTLLKIAKNKWHIATGTMDIALLEISSLEGEEVSLLALAKHYQLKSGDCLLSPSHVQHKLYQEISENIIKYEKFWVKKYSNFNAASFPFLPIHVPKRLSFSFKPLTMWTLSDEMLNQIKYKHGNEIKVEHVLLSVWLIYLYRINTQKNVSIILNSQSLKKLPVDLYSLIAIHIPLAVEIEEDSSFDKVLKAVKESYEDINIPCTYLRDMLCRYPNLNNIPAVAPIAVNITEEIDDSEKYLNALLVLKISLKEKRLIWFIESSLAKKENNLCTAIKNIPGHFENLLAASIKNKTIKVKQLPLLTFKEQKTLLYKWNNTQADYPRNLLIHELFEQQVIKNPDKIAVFYNNSSLTYSQLNKKANQIAYYLIGCGCKAKQYVALYMEKSYELVVAILGILKAGAAYIPIAIKTPLEQIKLILQDSNASIIITGENTKVKIRNAFSGRSNLLKIICLDEDRSLIEEYKSEDIKINITSNDFSYVIYTSGSTGIAKGVIIRHYSLVNLIIEEIKKLNITSESRILQFASISFDASVWEIFSALVSGATLYVPSEEQLLAGKILSHFINQYKITIVTLPPSVLRTLQPYEVTSLKIIVSAGEHCPQELANYWLKHVYFINAYGPTEATVCATMAQIQKNCEQSPSIGKPIANTTAYVLDKHLNLVPVGVVGELYIGGDGLAFGYLNNPELTNKFFISNPFASFSTEKLYRTRDLVRWLPDGNLEYIGRIDNQIKIRGYRVEPEVIERQILHHGMVKQCVVSVQQNEKLDKYLVAYIVTKKQQNFDVNNLRYFLKKILPDYMIPSFFVSLPKLPLTSNGKINRASLPLLNVEQRFNEVEYVAPFTPIQVKLSKIWSNLFGIDNIGINDNFFSLGGNSLHIADLLIKLMKEFNCNLSVQTFLELPTISNLAELITQGSVHEKQQQSIFRKDQILDASIKPQNIDNCIQESSTIFLTGATGFLGVHLLYELYHLTDAKIYCLMRCNSVQHGLAKLGDLIKRYKLNITLSERIVPVIGDLSQPLLGLSREQFCILAEKIDIIYHSGAFVHHIYDYTKLRATNVLGTIELLKLATLKKNKALHFVSTLSALTGKLSEKDLIMEDFVQNNSHTLPSLNGYNQTKWVCETLLKQADEQGVNLKIYRPGLIFGQSNTGIIPFENNHILLLLQGCIQMGYAPNWEISLNVLPVDIISKFIVAVSLSDKIKDKVFNLISPYMVNWIDLIKLANHYGCNVKVVPPDTWRRQLLKLKSNNSLFRLLSIYIYEEESLNKMLAAKITNSNSERAMRALGISFLMSKEKLLANYFLYLEVKKFLNLSTELVY